MAADARHTLDTLGLEAVVEARAGGQCLVLTSAGGPGRDGVDVIGEVLRDYGWELLTHGTRSPKVARWPRLLESLPMLPDGRPILRPVSTLEDARRSLLSCATARALAGALLGLQEVCCDVWHDLWSQCCDGSCVRHDLCFRSDATGAGRHRRLRFISVPPPLYAGHVESVPIGGGLRRGGHCGTQGRCPQVPGGQSRVT